MKCHICKYAKCRWIALRPNPETLSTDELEEIVSHNISYIDMTFSGNQGSAYGEELMYTKLEPYCAEIENRRCHQKVAIYKITGELVIITPDYLNYEVEFSDGCICMIDDILGGPRAFELIGAL